MKITELKIGDRVKALIFNVMQKWTYMKCLLNTPKMSRNLMEE
jgi:hypothetical protein